MQARSSARFQRPIDADVRATARWPTSSWLLLSRLTRTPVARSDPGRRVSRFQSARASPQRLFATVFGIERGTMGQDVSPASRVIDGGGSAVSCRVRR